MKISKNDVLTFLEAVASIIENMGIEPAFNTKMLKDLYQKLAELEWKADD